MAARIEVLPDARAVGVALASRIAAAMVDRWAAGERYVLGCPGGRSLGPTYAALPEQIAARGGPAGSVLIVMMDEYVVGAPADPRPIPIESHASCTRFGREVIAGPLRRAGLADVEVWVPDPADPGRYDTALEEVGGVDLFLLASGASDGHVAFNPQGTPREARTRIVDLAEATRRDNLRTFPDFASVEDVPDRGVTVGPATIADRSRALALVVTGEEKQVAFSWLAQADDYDVRWPATVVHAGPPATVYADAAAAGGGAPAIG